MDFVKSYFGKNEPLITADLEKNGGQKCSIGQRFISIDIHVYFLKNPYFIVLNWLLSNYLCTIENQILGIS